MDPNLSVLPQDQRVLNLRIRHRLPLLPFVTSAGTMGVSGLLSNWRNDLREQVN